MRENTYFSCNGRENALVLECISHWPLQICCPPSSPCSVPREADPRDHINWPPLAPFWQGSLIGTLGRGSGEDRACAVRALILQLTSSPATDGWLCLPKGLSSGQSALSLGSENCSFLLPRGSYRYKYLCLPAKKLSQTQWLKRTYIYYLTLS